MIHSPLQERVKALEDTIGPRHISKEERETMWAALGGGPGKIRIASVSPDDEAAAYANEIAEFLQARGWDEWGPDFPADLSFRTETPTIGLILNAPWDQPVVAYEGAQRLASALAEAKIFFRYYVSFNIHKGSCELVVGYRGTPPY